MQQSYFSNIDKKLSMSFSMLIFLIVGVIFLVTAYYFNYIIHKEQNRLGSVIANSVGDSVNRVSFSGKYQARLLIEDLKNKNVNIDSIVIQEPSGMVIAHSSSEYNGVVLQDKFFEKAKEVMTTDKYTIQNVLFSRNGKDIDFIEIDIPYKKGQDNDVVGVTRVFLAAETFNASIVNAMIFLAIFAFCLSIISYFIVKKLSANISTPIKNLAFQLQGILQYAPLLIYITNRNGDILASSPLYDKQKASLKLIIQEIAAEKSVFESGAAINYDYILGNDAKTSYFRASKYPIAVEEKNGVTLVCTIAVDITEQKELELMITSQKEEFETLFFATKDGIAIMDLEANFLDFNDAYLEMTGFTRQELLGKNCINLSAPEDILNVKNMIKQANIDGYIKDFEKTCIIKNNTRIVVNMSIALLPDKARFIVSAKDVTKQKRFEQDLQAMVKQETEKRLEKERLLTQQSKLAAMGEMISNIAHQWRQPLNALALKAQDVPMALEYGELDKEYAQAFKQDSMYLINYMSQTIEDFRNFFKPEKEKSKFDVVEYIGKARTLTKDSMEALLIEIIVVHSDTEIFTYGYPNEFAQVILNIINNAKDAFVNNSIKNGKINITISKEDSRILILICDNAGGIPDDIMDKIYDPYFTTKDKTQGTGLGLYMSKMIIEQNMGGSISASNTHTGVCFSIILPMYSNL